MHFAAALLCALSSTGRSFNGRGVRARPRRWRRRTLRAQAADSAADLRLKFALLVIIERATVLVADLGAVRPSPAHCTHAVRVLPGYSRRGWKPYC